MVFYSLIQKYTQGEPVFQERAKKKKERKEKGWCIITNWKKRQCTLKVNKEGIV